MSGLGMLVGAVASAIGGRYTDTIGRVRLLVPTLFLTGVCCFCMALVSTPTEFFMVRIPLSIIDGVAMAATAPLVRDFSPRMGRAQAFSFWTPKACLSQLTVTASAIICT